MKVAESETYFGDINNKNGTIQSSIEIYKSKGQGKVSDIMAIIIEISLGKYKTDVAMKLREVMLLNAIFYNSEAWNGVTKKHVKI